MTIISDAAMPTISLPKKQLAKTAKSTFRVNLDKTDNETPHLVYGLYSYCDAGVFSSKPVPFSVVPKARNIWTSSGLPLEREWPVPQLLVMLGFNLLAGLAALIALLRYDPR